MYVCRKTRELSDARVVKTPIVSNFCSAIQGKLFAWLQEFYEQNVVARLASYSRQMVRLCHATISRVQSRSLTAMYQTYPCSGRVSSLELCVVYTE